MAENKTVLVAVLKDKRDLGILKKHLWYRIPASHGPRPHRGVTHIAFYQPLSFARNSNHSFSCVRCYAKIKKIRIFKRIELLPGEHSHPNAQKNYLKISFSKLIRLKHKITNKNRMRVVFGYTTLKKLLKAREVIELFGVPPIENILARALRKTGIPSRRQHIVMTPSGKRYILDFAVFSGKKPLNIECDGEKSHSLRAQRHKDIIRDRYLRKNGWKVLRLMGKEIINDTAGCIRKIKRALRGA
ncbi:MAG: hypothetical protein A2297_05320 [Elusimicrobia bacterium RIFOXYB2_FULL_48_7]|nr:MAG: hypothetical protein A2297_05320 [Elusimicrobia bacterium RIFOXYB2_FULL_48_7]